MVILPMRWSSSGKECKGWLRAISFSPVPHLEVSISQPIQSRFVTLDGTPKQRSHRHLSGVIGPEHFYALAMEMVKANPEIAINAFHAATVKALSTALHPPKPEPEPVSKLISLKRAATNAPQTTNTVST
jgi:hypothetical protein